jgi:hypothetical protein
MTAIQTVIESGRGRRRAVVLVIATNPPDWMVVEPAARVASSTAA